MLSFQVRNTDRLQLFTQNMKSDLFLLLLGLFLCEDGGVGKGRTKRVIVVVMVVICQCVM